MLLPPDDPWLLACGYQFYTPEGQGVSHYGLGQSISFLPWVIVADWLSYLLPEESRERFTYLAPQFIYTFLILPILAALSLVLVFRLTRRMGMTERHAFWTAIAFGFTTFWYAYTRIVGMNLELILILLAALDIYTAGKPTILRRGSSRLHATTGA